jgi:hypothetical protein
MKFHLLVGQFEFQDKTQKPIKVTKDPETGERTERYPVVRVDHTMNNNNCIVESDVELVETFGSEKFRKVGDDVPTYLEQIEKREERRAQRRGETVKKKTSKDVKSEKNHGEGGHETLSHAELDAMTIGELKSYAGERAIDIGDASKKSDIIHAIRKGQRTH